MSGARRWRYAIVTGASSGIGEAVARRLASEGTELLLLGRDRARTEGLATALGCSSVVSDLATPEGMDAASRAVEQVAGVPALLVNAAGYNDVVPFLEGDLRSHLDLMMVNATAT